MTHTQDNAYAIHQYMTSLPKNVYKEQLLGNFKRALMTNHHHATDHRHRLTTLQDVIIASIIKAEIMSDHHHRSVIVIKYIQDVRTTIGHHHHMHPFNKFKTTIHAIKGVTVIKATTPEIYRRTTMAGQHPT